MKPLLARAALGVSGLMLIAAGGAPAQPLVLSGTNYLQDFQTLASGLPVGWSVRDDATATSLGVPLSFTATPTPWLLASGIFANMASADNTDTNGVPFTGGGLTDNANQNAATNRALGVRLSAALDPGAAFVLQISNTIGFKDFVLSLDLMTLTTFSRTSIWTIDYAVGDTPTSFTPLGVYYEPTPGFFGWTNRTFALPASVNDQSQNVWIRVANITAVSQSGNRDAVAIDNVRLSWSLVPPSTDPPVILTQPQSRTNNAGTTALFTVEAGGSSPLAYQWRRFGTNLLNDDRIAGATSSTLQIAALVGADAGHYSVVITNAYGAVTSAVAVLTVVDPAILTSPLSRTNVAGDTAQLSALGAGTLPLSYQWRRHGTNIPGASGLLTNWATQTLTLTNLQPATAGAYTFIVSNALGVATSAVATLTLLPTPAVNLATWTFNSDPADDNPLTGVDTPASGSGTATILGVTPGFNLGSVSDPASPGADNSGWTTRDYAPQGTENKLRGVQFSVSTVGYQDVLLTWEQRHSARASRYVRLQYTTNGVDYLDDAVLDLGGQQNNFVLLWRSLAAVPAVNNNPNFAFRLVAEFEDTATGSTNASYAATDPTQSYGGSGEIRFDMVRVFANALGTAAPIQIQSFSLSGGVARLDFTAGNSDVPSNFTLQSAGVVSGPYTNAPATITQLAPGLFRAERALSGAQQFYRIRRN
ncbi:MAG: immunoglobulin domain-containing protein [Verrucomicrobiales bacterium]|nr:immunoglobulin domain-containing protein [Verrucomicrobiales bacterium]